MILLNDNTSEFHSILMPNLVPYIQEIYDGVISTDMIIFKDMILLRIGPIDKITPKVLLYMLHKIFLVNCIVKKYDYGILDVKDRFMPYTMTIEQLDMLHK